MKLRFLFAVHSYTSFFEARLRAFEYDENENPLDMLREIFVQTNPF